ncbi:MFS transporter [Thalassiella azotivora]
MTTSVQAPGRTAGEPVAAHGGDRASFRRLWAAAGLANLGDGMGLVAVPLLAATLTRDPVLVGALTAAVYLPYLLLAVPAGVLVDRVERRTAMLAANGVRAAALVAVCAGLAAEVLTLGWVFALVLVLGAAECGYDAAAEGAVPRLVPADALAGANARLQGTVQVANSFLGAPAGAALFAVAAVAPFGLQAVLVVAASVLVTRLPRLSPGRREPREDRAGRSTLAADAREGLGWLRRHRGLRALAAVSAVAALANTLAQATLVLFLLEELRVPPAAFGAVTAVAAAGAVAGAVLAPGLGRRCGRAPVMVLSVAVQAVTVALVGLARDVAVVAVAFALFASAVAVWNVHSVSLRQHVVPARLYGRVHGVWRTAVWGALPVGAWLGGVVAAQWGLRAPWLVGAGIYLLVLPATVAALRRVAAGGGVTRAVS